MLKSTKLKNTLLVGATVILVSCGEKKEWGLDSYIYDIRILKRHGIEDMSTEFLEICIIRGMCSLQPIYVQPSAIAYNL